MPFQLSGFLPVCEQARGAGMGWDFGRGTWEGRELEAGSDGRGKVRGPSSHHLTATREGG